MTERRDVKVTLIGFGGTGKTSLLQQHRGVPHTDGLRMNQYSLDIATMDTVSQIDGTILSTSFWDTGPSENMMEFLPFYLAHSDVVIVVYSVVHRASFEAARNLMRMVIEELGKDACLVLVANKVDVSPTNVTREEGAKLAASFQARFEETCATDGTNVSSVFLVVEEFIANSSAAAVRQQRQQNGHTSMWTPSTALYPVAPVATSKPPGPVVTQHGDNVFHVVCLGDARVGKTTFIRTFARQSQLDRDDGGNTETVSITQHCRVVNGMTVYMWDTPGTVELRSLCVAAIAEADAILVLHDMSQPLSLKSAQEWVLRVKSLRSDVPMYVVSNTRTGGGGAKETADPPNIDVPCTQCVLNAMRASDVDPTIAHLILEATGTLLQDLL
eukprot:PhM_4_TR11874/c0_g1_i1/m.69526